MIRTAELPDLPGLTQLENASFSGDRLSRRQFRHFLTRGRAATLVDVANDGRLRGYALVLFNKGSALARLYSLAVDPACRGEGIAAALLGAAEAAALTGGCAYLRLEVRADNAIARHLYQQAGYSAFGTYAHYYDDAEDAVRMQKALAPMADVKLLPVDYYEQRLKFTCGPAALMVALHALDRHREISDAEEIRLWREATTIFMTAGHGGCSAQGLALAAARRGFAASVFVNRPGAPFLDSVRVETKKSVMRLVHDDFMAEIAKRRLPIHDRAIGLDEMKRQFAHGGVPIVLVSSYRFDKEKTPHWVVVTGFDGRFVYIHDPYVDAKEAKTPTDCMHIPVAEKDFLKMARFGRHRLQATVIVKKRRKG